MAFRQALIIALLSACLLSSMVTAARAARLAGRDPAGQISMLEAVPPEKSGAEGGIIAVDDVDGFNSVAIVDAEKAREAEEAKKQLQASGGDFRRESAKLDSIVGAKKIAQDRADAARSARRVAQERLKKEYGWVDTDIDEGIHMLAGNRGNNKKRDIFPRFAASVRDLSCHSA